jgi:serine/threonine-protein kinase
MPRARAADWQTGSPSQEGKIEEGVMADNPRSVAPGAGDDDEPTRLSARPISTGEVQPGTLISHTYRIEAMLARGGMGEVFRARHVELNTPHAIKMILPELAENPKVLDLFRREASVLRTVRSDVVVAYDGIFRDEHGRLVLVMEFIEGHSLKTLLKDGPLPQEDVRRLRDRLAGGFAAAHEKGVIHRDISPDNVIIPDTGVDNAKIIDFGIAKLADPAVKTVIGDDFAGKYSYASPEQLGMFGGKVDHRSDIYSLGLVLAAAALGEPLDMGSSHIAVVEARRQVPDLSRVPEPLRSEIAPMLEPDPALRPSSMAALVAGGKPPARPAAARPAQPAPEPPRRVAFEAPVEERRKSGGGILIAVGAVVLLAALGAGGWFLWPREGGPDQGPVAGTTGSEPPVEADAAQDQTASQGQAPPQDETPEGQTPPDEDAGPAPGDEQQASLPPACTLGEGPVTPETLRALAPCPPDRIFAAASTLLTSGDPDNALPLLMVAAQGGVGQAALEVGRMYDPVLWGRVATPFTSPNPEKAREWYQKAADLGVAEATPLLDKLGKWQPQ